ncbi:MAG: GNAT family N-acetyltransferase [Candidatus Latescibacteria bacterium]|nr:GNAT family N-acetyltransferase [Candidatus Latescibacterota bacterium]
MTSPTVKIATEADAASVVDSMVIGFCADPLGRWCWTDPQAYIAHFPTFIRLYGGQAFSHGSAYYVDGYLGGALWLPPGIHPDEEALGAHIDSTVPAAKHADLYGLLERMGQYHPEEPHWFLSLISVEPMHQNKGCGSALLEHALERCDSEHLPAYLESSNPRNISLYQRHGFQVLDTFQVGTTPPVAPMLRKAQ